MAATTDIAGFIGVLKAGGFDHLAHESVADFVYLSQYWDLFTATPAIPILEPPPAKRAHESKDESQTKPSDSTTVPESVPSNKDTTGKAIFPDTPHVGLEGAPASRIAVPDPASLPNPLLVARALRPLARRLSSKRDSELDEEQSADESARQELLTPVFRPVQERWFELFLLVEDTVSMAVWKRAIDEFAALTGTHGAFRDVRRAKFRVAGTVVEIIDTSGRTTGLKSVLDPQGRRLVLLFTHGATKAWAAGALHQALVAWGVRQPVAIVQMLPEKSWEHTVLGEPDCTVRAQRPGSANRSWTVQRAAWQEALHPNGLAIPVLTLRHQDVGQWARMLMAQGAATMPSYFVSEDFEAEDSDAKLARSPAAVLVSRFRANSSDEAWRLAVALAGSPLMLPVMRLVQSTIFPAGKVEQVHLAELLLGGLMERVNKTDDPERDAFEFHPGVRDLLAESMPLAERYKVRAEVFSYIQQHQDALRVFPALVPQKDGKEWLPRWATPFAADDEEYLRATGVAQVEDADTRRFHAGVTAIAYSPLGKLAVGLADGTLEFNGTRKHFPGPVVDIHFLGEEPVALPEEGYVDGVAPSFPTKCFALVGDRTVMASGSTLALSPTSFEAFDAPITSLAACSSSSLAVGRENGAVDIVHLNGAKSTILRLNTACTALASRDISRVAAGSDSGEVMLWEEPPYGPPNLQTIQVEHRVAALAFSSDGRLAAAVGNEIEMWDGDFATFETFIGHAGAVTSIAWSQDNQLTSGSVDGTVRFWSTKRLATILFAGSSTELESLLIARGHTVRRELDDECRAIVWPEGEPVDIEDDTCIPVVRYGPQIDPVSIFEQLDAALALPPAGGLYGLREPSKRYVPHPEQEEQLRKYIDWGDAIIAVTGSRRVGKTDLICKVLRECNSRRRFAGGIFRSQTPQYIGPGLVARVGKIRDFSPDWERPNDILILEGTHQAMEEVLGNRPVHEVDMNTTLAEGLSTRLAEFCICETRELPGFVVETLGSSPFDKELADRGLITYTMDGGVSVEESTYARLYFPHANRALQSKVAAALDARPFDPFSLKYRLSHWIAAQDFESALEIARDPNWLVPALEQYEQIITGDLTELGLKDLLDLINRSNKPIRARLAESKDLPFARAVIRAVGAPAIYVDLAGTGQHELEPTLLEVSEAVGRAIALAGWGLITGAWPGVDFVTARSYQAAGGKYLLHVVDSDSTDRFSDALVLDPGGTKRSLIERAAVLADGLVMIGGLGGTMDVFEAARKFNKPVFPYGPSGGDAQLALLNMKLSPRDELRLAPTAERFAALVVERLKSGVAPRLTNRVALYFANPQADVRYAYAAARDLAAGEKVDELDVHLACQSDDASLRDAGLALWPFVATPDDVRGLAGSLVSDRESNPELAALALNDMLQEPRNWERLGDMDNGLTALTLLGSNKSGDLIQGIRILNALSAYYFRTPTQTPKDLGPLLRSVDRSKRVFALEHIEYDSLDNFEQYLEHSDRDLGEDGQAGEAFRRFALNYAKDIETETSPLALANTIEQSRIRIENMAQRFHSPKGRARFDEGAEQLRSRALDEVQVMVYQKKGADVFALLDAAETIANLPYQRQRLDFLRARLLWPSRRDEAVTILKHLDPSEIKNSGDVRLISDDPALREELMKIGFSPLAEMLEDEKSP